MSSPNPFMPNLKLEAMHAAIQLEKLNVDKQDDVHDADALLEKAKTIHTWLSDGS